MIREWRVRGAMIASSTIIVLVLGCEREPKDRPRPIFNSSTAAPERLPTIPLSAMEPTVRSQFDAALEAVRTAPSNAQPIGAVGMLLLAYQQDVLAEAYFRTASEMASDEPRWWYYLGVTLAERGALDDAALAFGRVLSHSKEAHAAVLRLAEVDRRRNRYETALAGYEEAIASGHDLARAHCGAGQVLLAQKRAQKAVVHLSAALELEPRFGRARYALGMALRELGQTDEAIAQLRLAEGERDAEPPLEDPWTRDVDALATGAITAMHGGIELLQGNPAPQEVQRAVALLREAIRIDPHLAEAHSQLGAALLLLNEIDEAESSIRTALQLRPEYADALYNLGLIAYRRGEDELAQARFREALAVQPAHFDAHLGLGIALIRAGQPEASIEQLERAAALRPSDPRAHKHLGTQLIAFGRYREGAAALRRGVAALPNDQSLAQRLAWLLATAPDDSVRNPEESLRLAEGVCAIIDHPRALDTLAAAQAALGRYDEAAATAREALVAARERDDARLEAEIQKRLQLYQSGAPYRSPATSD